MLVLFQFLAVVTIIATLIAILQKKAWWIRVFDFPRLQIITLQILSLIVMMLVVDEFSLINTIITGFTIVAFIIQIFYVFPYLPFAPKDIEDLDHNSDNVISLMVSNVLMTNRVSHKLLSLVEKYKPDLLLTVETDTWWQQQLKSLDKAYPHSVKIPQDNTYGMLLFSRFPLEDIVVDHIIKKDIPSINAVVEKDGFRIRLYCVHPEPPAPDEADSSGPRDRELVVVGKRVAANPAPYIVMGDLNDVAWSDTSNQFRKLSKLKDPRMGRGFYNTFHTKTPLFRFALDHFFVSDDFRFVELDILPKIGSDHFPIFMKVGIK